MKNKWYRYAACLFFLVSFGVYFYYFIIASLAGGLLYDVMYLLIVSGILFLLISLGLFLKPLKGFSYVCGTLLVAYEAMSSFMSARGYLANLGHVFKTSTFVGLSSIMELVMTLLFLVIVVFLALFLGYSQKSWANKLGSSVFYLLLGVALCYFVQSIFLTVAYHATTSDKLAILPIYRGFLFLGLGFVYSLFKAKMPVDEAPKIAQA
jgi:hypothetical protein